MAEPPSQIRTPVRRVGAEKYLLLTLFSFAASISLTRLFLYATGYPQIGNSELHIAHVLWGGLFLYAAALVPLIYANRWVYEVSGILSGVGIGLFIDEVGKFITQSNNYFYPPAAPIIYAFFLLSVLLYQRIRKPRQYDVRTELYSILDGLGEVLDHDLSDTERTQMIRRLDEIIADPFHPELDHLARALKEFITHEQRLVIAHQPGLVERAVIRLSNFEERYLSRWKLRALLAGSMLALAIWALSYPVQTVMLVRAGSGLEPALQEMIRQGILGGAGSLNWLEARLALEISVGLVMLVSAALLIGGSERRAIAFGYLGLLLSLTTVNLLIFYFNQFSTILTALVQFVVLLGLIHYRSKYLRER